MTFWDTYGNTIISGLCSLIPFAAKQLQRRAGLKYGSPHSFSHLVDVPVRDGAGNIVQPTQIVRFHSLEVVNTGRAALTNVRLTFNWKPQYISLWPIRPYKSEVADHNRYMMVFDNVRPKEIIRCESFTINQEHPDLLSVVSDQVEGRQVEWMAMPRPSKARIYTFIALAMFGFSSAIYLVLELVEWYFRR